MERRWLITVLVAVVFAVAAEGARADVESPSVKRGLAAYNDLDYPKAIQCLEQARLESLTREEKLVTYQTLAMAHVALGDNELARADFQRLLRLDPSFQLDRRIAPKVRAVFEEAKAAVATDAAGVRSGLSALTPELSPPRPRAGQPLTIRVQLAGGLAHSMALYHRLAGQRQYSRVLVPVESGGHFEATIPGGSVQAPGVEYHVALLDDAGAAVAQAGSLGQPTAIEIAAPRKPVYRKGWFWGVMGGVVAAAAVATTLAFTLPQDHRSPITVIPQ
jgi:tetratricopeptide (TPR) repeat protein